MENKKCIYTCITGGYEELSKLTRVSPNFDYICFTDQDIKNDFWQIRQLPKETDGLSTVKKQRYVKINAHKVLPEYEFSIWIDGNVDIKGDIDKFVEENCQKEYGVITMGRHPERDCVYDEVVACVKYKKDIIENMLPQAKKYLEEGLPRHYGLVQTCLLFRYHNDPKCIKFTEDWWSELYNNKSHRDQLSISYVTWKNSDVKINYLSKKVFRGEYFYWGVKHDDRKIKKYSTQVMAKPSEEPINLCIIHHNTPYLTECLIKSINKFTPKCTIYIFDNSDKDPFTYRQDNIIYIDNTKGHYIDFKKWLDKYPNRVYSGGKKNEWGSAKHCYTIEKCMDIIGKNFILLDSDILLKQDISNLYDSKYIFVGTIEKQPYDNIMRALPFICYINVDMCRKNGIHYFNDTMMHGLYNKTKNPMADQFDTGAAFYYGFRQHPYKEINYKDYIEHFKAGSWESDKKSISSNEWLEKYANLWKEVKKGE